MEFKAERKGNSKTENSDSIYYTTGFQTKPDLSPLFRI